jgi:hypothetical protein
MVAVIVGRRRGLRELSRRTAAGRVTRAPVSSPAATISSEAGYWGGFTTADNWASTTIVVTIKQRNTSFSTDCLRPFIRMHCANALGRATSKAGRKFHQANAAVDAASRRRAERG